MERAARVGEPVAAVGDTRTAAEEGASLVAVDWEPPAAATDMRGALDGATPVPHPDMGTR